MNAIKRKFVQFSNWDFTALYKLPGSLLINEQPFRDWTARAKDPKPFISMPLAPNALLFGQPPKEKGRRHMQLAWVSAPGRPNLVKVHNTFIVETARQWVVGASAAAISAVARKLFALKCQSPDTGAGSVCLQIWHSSVPRMSSTVVQFRLKQRRHCHSLP
jgi:hypothetical protein